MANIPNADQWYVLIVEDKVDSFITVGRLLEHAGVKKGHYIWKSTGLDVIGVADATAPRVDLILLDLGLHNEDGYEILTKLKAEPQYQHTKVVAVTGHVSIEEMRRAQEAGFDGFLGKPLDYERFPGQLNRLMNDNTPVWDNK